jgi:ATP-dependent helicase/nuclease subunit B
LDFERIIILGANEGQFPPNRGNDSFIPIALRRHFGLPDGKDQHALYAYYVYRLLHRSRQVDFVYSQAESIIGNNEISHLIYQINNDVPKASVQFCTMQIGVPNSREAFGVYSDEAIQNRTRELLARGISASALNTFLRCPLDFYYKYLVNLREPNEVEEQIGLATYGTIVHDVLESAYRGLIGQALSTSDIDKILLGLHERVDFSTQKIFQDREMDFGINLLTKESAYASLVRFFKWEQSQIEHLATMGQHLQINTLETKLEADIHVEGHLIKMKGVIDRIDYCCDQLRIIDYKTGGVEQKDLNLDSSFIKILDGNQPKALQLLTYGYLWKKNMAKSDNLSAGIISLKNISNDFIPLTEDKKPFNWLGIEEQFSDLMRQIVSRMLSPELSYIHNSKSDYCSYCP